LLTHKGERKPFKFDRYFFAFVTTKATLIFALPSDKAIQHCIFLVGKQDYLFCSLFSKPKSKLADIPENIL